MSQSDRPAQATSTQSAPDSLSKSLVYIYQGALLSLISRNGKVLSTPATSYLAGDICTQATKISPDTWQVAIGKCVYQVSSHKVREISSHPIWGALSDPVILPVAPLISETEGEEAESEESCA